MRVFYNFNDLPHFLHPAVTVGSYDGVHLGHQALIARLVSAARTSGGESIVLTFDPHPRVTLGCADGLQLLTTLDQKIELLENLGVDHLIVIPFDKAFSTLSGADFIRQYILGRLATETLVVGYNHRFGHDRLDGHALEAMGDLEGLRIVRVDECSIDGHHISSTVIRRLIAEGRSTEAEQLLGHPLTRSDSTTYEINPARTNALINTLVTIWRGAVEATHIFLPSTAIEDFVPTVRMALETITTLVVDFEQGRPVAFIGVEAGKIEVLFVDCNHLGKGHGRKLIELAIAHFEARKVDVNELNPGAHAFYQRMGFKCYGRTECDDQGNPYAILKLKL